MTDPFPPQTSHLSQIPRGVHQSAIERAGPGTVVGGRYTLLAAVGHGGMGTVWRATDTQLGRQVAVKEVVTPPGIAPEDRDAMYERMLREARAAAVLSHPGVVQVYDVVTDGERPWIVMELLAARSLSDMVLEDGPLAPRAVAKIGVTLLGALEVAHAAGVLHRDVKPANVLVCTDGRCVLTDFGVARMPTDQQLTTPGMVLGSPHFISPERALGASFGPPSDLFSLGVTLFCAVEGRPPFDKGEPIATMHSVVEDDPLPPQRAGVLTEVLYGLLEKNPERRWDAARSRAVLRELLAGPLASRTPQFPTDPYSIVPAQRPPWQQPVATAAPAAAPAAADAGAGDGHRQIGGRALLAPGEDPTQRVPAGAGRPPGDGAGAGAGAGWSRSDGPGGGRHSAGPVDPDATGAYPHLPGDPTAGMPTVSGPGRRGGRTGNRSRAGGHGRAGSGPATVGQRLTETAERVGVAARQAGTALAIAAQRAPRRATMVAAAGLAAVVLIAAVWMLAGGEDQPEPQAQGTQSDQAGDSPGGGPLISVQEFAGRGLTVNLPEGWEQAEDTAIRLDFVDPGDPAARIRLLTEPSGADSRRFIEEFAEPSIADNCSDQYQRLGLTDIQLDGHPATLLEYSCGNGGDAQRTNWVTTVRDGTAYSFFFRTSADQFEERSVIFDELLRSFRVVSA